MKCKTTLTTENNKLKTTNYDFLFCTCQISESQPGFARLVLP